MVLLGKVEKIQINSSGLDCCVSISFNDIGILRCYMLMDKWLDYSERNTSSVSIYVEDSESEVIFIGQERNFKLSTEFINQINIDEDKNILGIEQPIYTSSHTIFHVKIKELVNENSFICEAGNFSFLVEPEIKIPPIRIGDRVYFKGEIKAEFA